MNYWYMSFVDTETDVFVGSVVVKGVDEFEAMTNSHKVGANPGGEVAMAPIPFVPDEIEINRFYSLAEMLSLGHVGIDDLGSNTRQAVEDTDDRD